MAFTYGFYNYSASDASPKLYDAEDMSKIFDGIITDGVYAHVGDKFNVTAAGSNVNNKVVIGTGRAWLNHTWSYNSSSVTFDAPSPPVENKRIDALVIDIDTSHRINEFKWHQGTVSATPVKPTLTKSGSHYEYALCYVTRTAGTPVITAADIENAVGTDETPYVTGVLQQISASQILENFENEFSNFLSMKSNEFAESIQNDNAEFGRFIELKRVEFENFLGGVETRINEFFNYEDGRITNFMGNKSTEFDNLIAAKNEEFSEYLAGLTTRFNSYLADLDTQCQQLIQRYALVAEGFANGEQNGEEVTQPTSPYYHHNAKYFANVAKTYSTNPPYIGPNGNWYIWDTTTNDYIDSGIDASITVTIADITMLPTTESPRVTNTGTSTDPIFHLFIPRGVGISSISKTGTSGLVDTYTIYYTNNTTSTFQVTNGKSAYQAAKDGGYTGTEAEFNDSLANFKTYAEGAATSATNAANSANSANSSKNAAATSATNAANSASEASTSAQNAEGFKDEAEGFAADASNSADSAEASAVRAADSASGVVAYNLIAEGFAIGKQNGEEVDSSSPYYHNNSKYFYEQSESLNNTYLGYVERSEEAATRAEDVKADVYGAIGIPEFNIDFITGKLMYSDDSKYNFTINTTTGQLTYAPV